MRVVEVFADVLCPFTYVGLRRLAVERDRRSRRDVVLRCRAWPLELVNGRPLDPAEVAEEVAALRQSIAPGLFRGFDPATFPRSSLRALALAADADAVSVELGESVSFALRAALFEEGRDVDDGAVLGALASQFGLGGAPFEEAHIEALARAEMAEGRARGVIGSPHFFVDATAVFCPTLNIARDDGRFSVEVDWSELEAFLALCFA